MKAGPLLAVLCTVTACGMYNVVSPGPKHATPTTVIPVVTATKDPRCQECLERHSAQRTASALQRTPTPSPTGCSETDQISAGDPPSRPAQDQVEWALRNHTPVVILFHASDCDSCSTMRALLKSVASEPGPILFLELPVNEPEGSELVRQAGIGLVPAWYFLTKQGTGTLLTGTLSQDQLHAEIERLLN